MSKILITGAGGAPSNNFIRSLRDSQREDYLIGTSSIASDLFLADVDVRYVLPFAVSSDYPRSLLALIGREEPDFLHAQNDAEVLAVSRMRDDLTRAGVKLYLPDQQTVENCVDKFRSYQIWRDAEITVPETILIENEDDLKIAFANLGKKIWIRATTGGGGRGALPVDSLDFARLWIERFQGWGAFTASALLTPDTVTWLSIWHHGELIVAQARKRHSWNFGNRTLSGVTGITGVAETVSEPLVDQIAQAAIRAIDPKPHGIFGVDMTYDESGVPNPTEINIGRFFTTHYFFTQAGLNMPEIYCNIAINHQFPTLTKRINPLPDGLVWIRGMDVLPVMTTREELESLASSRP